MSLDATKENMLAPVITPRWQIVVGISVISFLTGGSIAAATMYYGHEGRLSSVETSVHVLTERSQRTNELLEQVVQLLMKRD